MTGNMPASPAGYQDPQLQKLFPAELLKLFQDERERGRAPHRHAVLE